MHSDKPTQGEVLINKESTYVVRRFEGWLYRENVPEVDRRIWTVLASCATQEAAEAAVRLFGMDDE